MTIRTTPFDAADYLDSDEAVAIYMSEALETGEPAYIAHALGKVAKARGMSQVAQDAGLGRESLYKSLGRNGNPELGTILRVMRAVGMKLVAAPAEKRDAA